MERATVILGGAILPFSAVLVPEVGRGHERPAFATIAAMRRAARALTALDAALLLLLLPPSTATGGKSPAAYAAPDLVANLDEAAGPEAVISARGAPALAAAIVHAGLAESESITQLPAAAAPLLYFLRPALLSAPLLAVQLPPGGEADSWTTHRAFGTRLAALPALAPSRVAVAVGAELSSRIFPGAPGGYHPDGARFDAAVQSALNASDLDSLGRIRPALITIASEQAMGGLATLAGLLRGTRAAIQLLSYEAPFGTGLAVASFKALNPPGSR